jgi:hypothetical protein
MVSIHLPVAAGTFFHLRIITRILGHIDIDHGPIPLRLIPATQYVTAYTE